MNQELFFEYPQMAWMLLVAIAIALGEWSLFRYRAKIIRTYSSPRLLTHLLTPRSFFSTLVKGTDWILIWILGSIALSWPYGNLPSSSPIEKRAAAPASITLLVDVSASMGTSDGYQGSTRLESAKTLIKELLFKLNGRSVSLFAFTSELIPVVPATLDLLFTSLSLQELRLNEETEGGTAFAPVLSKLGQTVAKNSSSPKQGILMLSDGGDNRLEKEEASSNQALADILSSTMALKEKGVFLLSIGIGSLKPSPIPKVTTQEGAAVNSKLEEKALQALAQKLNGSYYRAQDWPVLKLTEALLSEIEKMEQEDTLQETNQRAENNVALFSPYYQIPLGFALFFYLLNLLLPDTFSLKNKGSLIAMMLASSSVIQAEKTSDFQQETERLFVETEAFITGGDPLQALILYEKVLGNKRFTPWQKKRITANRATAYLASKNPSQALHLFNDLVIYDLSMPRLASFFKFNQGVAYWMYAQGATKENPLPFPARYFFLKESLHCWQEAEKLEDLATKGSKHESPSPLLLSKTREGERSIVQLFQAEKKRLLENAPPGQLLFLLSLRIQDSLQFLSSLHEEPSALFFPPFWLEMNSFLPLWERIQKKGDLEPIKPPVTQAYQIYQEALAIKDSPQESKRHFQLSLELIEPLSSHELTNVDKIHFLLEVLFLQATALPLENGWIFKKISPLLATIKQEESPEAAARAEKYLEKSLALSLEGKEEMSRFFLVAADLALPQKMPKPPFRLLEVLEKSVALAEKTAWLFFLALKKSDLSEALTNEIFTQAEETTEAIARFFVAAVVEAQQLELEKNKSAGQECLVRNWKEIIFFYSEGIKKMRWVREHTGKTGKTEPLVATWLAALEDWQKALKAFLNPKKGGGSQANQTVKANIAELQEMHLEDQFQILNPPPLKSVKELHTW